MSFHDVDIAVHSTTRRVLLGFLSPVPLSASDRYLMSNVMDILTANTEREAGTSQISANYPDEQDKIERKLSNFVSGIILFRLKWINKEKLSTRGSREKMEK